MKGKAVIAVVFVIAAVTAVSSWFATSYRSQYEPRQNRSWSLWVRFDTCGAEIDRLIIHMQAEPSLGWIRVESREDFHIFKWDYTVTGDKVYVTEVLCAMAQKIYHVEILGRFTAEDESFVRHVWISPYGLSAQRLPPAPRWHGQQIAPEGWGLEYDWWLKLHEKHNEKEFWEEFDKLAFKRDRRLKLTLGIIGAGCAPEKEV